MKRQHIISLVCIILLSAAADRAMADTSPALGYNLFTPMNSKITYLMDNDGNFLRIWSSDYNPGLSVYLLEDGTLLRTAKPSNTTFNAGGAGGRIEWFSWEDELLWSYDHNATTYRQHHDIEMMPNGHILVISWELKSNAEAIAAGRNPSKLRGNLWPDYIFEIEPDETSGGTIVWQWHVWDHLIQDYDSTLDNYGVVADHPERININFMASTEADWNHINSVDYHAELDQIVLSVRKTSEIWVIDHSTTTEEAAGSTGGNCGMGGDLLYRWGNPQAYDCGTSSDQQLFGQHDAEWIEAPLSGEGDILIYNNGDSRTGTKYSTVDQITPPLQSDGTYALTAGAAYEPALPTWTYGSASQSDFYSSNISGSQRLRNGNTLICEGASGYFFEVTEDGTVVWEYDYGQNVFRVDRYSTGYAGFVGTELEPVCGDEGYTDLAGDVNADCYVDLWDIVTLGRQWQSVYDLADLAEVADNWLTCNDPDEPCDYVP